MKNLFDKHVRFYKQTPMSIIRQCGLEINWDTPLLALRGSKLIYCLIDIFKYLSFLYTKKATLLYCSTVLLFYCSAVLFLCCSIDLFNYIHFWNQKIAAKIIQNVSLDFNSTEYFLFVILFYCWINFVQFLRILFKLWAHLSALLFECNK